MHNAFNGPRRRWLALGAVRVGYSMFLQWGCPDVLHLNWRFPFTFMCWEDLFECIDRRLQHSGLRRTAAASLTQKDFYGNTLLYIEVRRDPTARRRRRSFSSPAPC